MKENDLKELDAQLAAIYGERHKYNSTIEACTSIWQKCPFKVGNRVRLTQAPEISEDVAWGWRGSKHFLVKGAVATVMEREFYSGLFCFALHFDDETWIDMRGVKRKPDKPSFYYFSENKIESMSEVPKKVEGNELKMQELETKYRVLHEHHSEVESLLVTTIADCDTIRECLVQAVRDRDAAYTILRRIVDNVNIGEPVYDSSIFIVDAKALLKGKTKAKAPKR